MRNIGKETFLKYKRHFLVLFGVAIIAAGFYAYNKYQEKLFIQEDAIDAFMENIPSQCENGEWIEFPDLEDSKTLDKFVGNARLKYDDKKDEFSNADNSQIFVTDEKYSLSFFMDRDARIEGWKIPDSNNVYVKKIKCVGEEANKDIQSQRRKIMNYISGNINNIALEKSRNGEWQVQSFYFYNNNDLYVEYEMVNPEEEDAADEDEELPFEARLWLIRIANPDRDVPAIETLAYIQEDEDDPDKNVLKIGQDIYKDVQNLTIYEYDEDRSQWVLQ
ncbi:MAG TPA: hypothetical protein P5099_04055 [Candidatus Moranbacteria bacterium]|nr:hypothetical protein [Candidatus Moranbacteria bacterium]HSA08515.1 hypothetical protein [Candidatus Moranbacteria bacterium]